MAKKMKRTLEVLELEDRAKTELKRILKKKNIDLEADLELLDTLHRWANTNHLLQEAQGR